MKHLAVAFIALVFLRVLWAHIPQPARTAIKNFVSPHFVFAILVLLALVVGLVVAFYMPANSIL